MSKELEALNYVWYHYYTSELDQDEVDEIEKNLNVVQDGLKRLESIDNSNPSEALECLEFICKILNEKRIDVKWLFKNDYNTIKQALINAQKEHNSVNLLMQELDCKDFAELRKYARCGYEKLNKKYLKWEDLEFDVPTTIKVKMGDTKYLLSSRIGLTDFKSVVLRDNNLKPFLHLYEKDKQFFNDLHLERVEE